jgi:NAD(P)H-dependent FMN reductase
MPKLHVIVASTREGRKGPAVADWFVERAREHGGFELRVIDLAEVNLPLLDEPAHPRLRTYTHEHTKAWSAAIDEADAFVFVTPEYDYGPPASLINAMQYLLHEWSYKPVAFVSYGGVSGGTRGVQVTKLTVTALRMVPIVEAVAIPFFAQYLDSETGRFDPGEVQAKAATAMLDELARLAAALAPLRA